jgi:hypothetical protein
MTSQSDIPTLKGPSNDDAMLLQFVRDREVPCPVCKYNLHALTVPRCPECGRALCLTVGAVEPFLAAWIITAIGSFGSSGIGALLTAFAICRPVHFHDPTQYLAWWSFTFSVPLAIGTVMFRRKFLRLPRGIQWILAVLVVTLSLGQIVGFIALIR